MLQDAYLETQVLTADPMELVRLLYRGARDAVRHAREHLAAGRIAERSHQISKAHAILTQLSSTLDHARGGKLSRDLAELYDYMQRRLLEANLRQKAEPLAEVENLLSTLLQGWEQIRTAPDQEAPRGSASVEREDRGEYGAYPAAFRAEPVSQYASQSWSF